MVLIAAGILLYFLFMAVVLVGFVGAGLSSLVATVFSSNRRSAKRSAIKHATLFPSYFVWEADDVCEACNWQFLDDAQNYCRECGCEREYAEIEYRYPGIRVN